MSVYNGEPYLQEAIESILNQTFEDFEFIIINDGSTDASQGIIDSFNDCRLVVIQQENIGLTKSLNKGLKIACGEYIARQDADDISLPYRFEKQVSFLNENPNIALLGTYCIDINHRGESVSRRKYPTTDEEIRDNLIKWNSFCHTSIMMRKEALKEVGGYDEQFKYSQDYDLWFRIAERWNVANIPEYLVMKRFERKMLSITHFREQAYYALLAKIRAIRRNQYPKWTYLYLIGKPLFFLIIPGGLVNLTRRLFFKSGKGFTYGK